MMMALLSNYVWMCVDANLFESAIIQARYR